MHVRSKTFRLMTGTAMALVFAGQAMADGTPAGQAVNNTATVGYSVGGVNQANVNSNTATFVVDRRVNLSVAELGGASTSVAPGQNSQVTTFTLTNTTNGPLDFRLTAAQDASGSTTAFNDTDSFDLTNVRVFVDANGNGIYDPAIDTATFVDALGADQSRTVFVVADVPAGQADGATAGVTLTAIAAESAGTGSLGSDVTQNNGADTPGSVDTVFGDNAGDTDAARDGRFSDDDEYDVVSASISLIKTSRVISDPFNNTTNPKAIPGAVIEYCIEVRNSGSAAANSAVVSDPVPSDTTYVAGSIFAAGSVTSGVCNADGTAEDDNSAGADETDPNGGNYTGTTVTVSLPSVAAGSSLSARFRATVK